MTLVNIIIILVTIMAVPITLTLTDLMPPQELAPFHRRIFFKGAAGSNGSAGSTPAGGRNISCSAMIWNLEFFIAALC